MNQRSRIRIGLFLLCCVAVWGTETVNFSQSRTGLWMFSCQTQTRGKCIKINWVSKKKKHRCVSHHTLDFEANSFLSFLFFLRGKTSLCWLRVRLQHHVHQTALAYIFIIEIARVIPPLSQESICFVILVVHLTWSHLSLSSWTIDDTQNRTVAFI